MPNKQHVHKYRKGKLSLSTNTKIYKCVLPDCSHYILAHLIRGRKSICWRCGNEFTIEREHQRMAKVHCSNCIKRKGPVKLDDSQVEDLLKDLGVYGE